MERMSSRVSAPVVILMTILIVVYATIGTLYAALTPAWQVPDEPAHYNYIRSLAEGRGFPILEKGDYNQAYQDRLTSECFPPELSIESVTYEDHQPPLYYLLATPVYLAFDGALVPLRLLSIVLGAGLLIVAFGTVTTVFPERPGIGLMVAAFIAFIPQHVAMTAGVNNDTLAELAVAGTLWALVIYVGGANNRPWAAGLLVGIALLTKTTAYIVAGVAVGAVLMRWYHEKRTWQWAGEQLAWILIPALLLSAPWFVRNGLTYGWSDPLGLARHNAVVADQPRSSEWLATHGWGGLLTLMARTTFQSFWGQFGWMAVPLPASIYRGLLFLSLLLIAGFLIRLVRRGLSSRPRPLVVCRCLLLTLSAALTFSAFLWYNLTFVQHQGRYLFPALIPLTTAAALGLQTLAKPVPRQVRSWTLGVFFVGLAAFDVYCLFSFVLPNL
jgi:4-amino-4-deoxy-L-arabinose transferase-like glycosyltransferase